MSDSNFNEDEDDTFFDVDLNASYQGGPSLMISSTFTPDPFISYGSSDSDASSFNEPSADNLISENAYSSEFDQINIQVIKQGHSPNVENVRPFLLLFIEEQCNTAKQRPQPKLQLKAEQEEQKRQARLKAEQERKAAETAFEQAQQARIRTRQTENQTDQQSSLTKLQQAGQVLLDKMQAQIAAEPEGESKETLKQAMEVKKQELPAIIHTEQEEQEKQARLKAEQEEQKRQARLKAEQERKAAETAFEQAKHDQIRTRQTENQTDQQSSLTKLQQAGQALLDKMQAQIAAEPEGESKETLKQAMEVQKRELQAINESEQAINDAEAAIEKVNLPRHIQTTKAEQSTESLIQAYQEEQINLDKLKEARQNLIQAIQTRIQEEPEGEAKEALIKRMQKEQSIVEKEQKIKQQANLIIEAVKAKEAARIELETIPAEFGASQNDQQKEAQVQAKISALNKLKQAEQSLIQAMKNRIDGETDGQTREALIQEMQQLQTREERIIVEAQHQIEQQQHLLNEAAKEREAARQRKEAHIRYLKHQYALYYQKHHLNRKEQLIKDKQSEEIRKYKDSLLASEYQKTNTEFSDALKSKHEQLHQEFVNNFNNMVPDSLRTQDSNKRPEQLISLCTDQLTEIQKQVQVQTKEVQEFQRQFEDLKKKQQIQIENNSSINDQLEANNSLKRDLKIQINSFAHQEENQKQDFAQLFQISKTILNTTIPTSISIASLVSNDPPRPPSEEDTEMGIKDVIDKAQTIISKHFQNP